MTKRIDARAWLRANGYGATAKLLDEIEREWRSEGLRTRRDWWAVLAGTRAGRPTTIAGRTLPVFRAARERQGLPDVAESVGRPTDTAAPPIVFTNRWPRREAPAADETTSQESAAAE